jgi:hypothetical protein
MVFFLVPGQIKCVFRATTDLPVILNKSVCVEQYRHCDDANLWEYKYERYICSIQYKKPEPDKEIKIRRDAQENTITNE